MARPKETQAKELASQGMRHPLLVYHNLGRRYRPPGILLVFMGLFLLFPSFISELENEWVDPAALAGVGVGITLVGMAFWWFARRAMRCSYVQCDPDVLVIRTPFYRVLISYRRIKHAQSVRVSDLFPKDSLTGLGKPLMRPLLPMTAVELHVTSWPASKKQLQRFAGRYLFSPRAEAWLLIVPNYSLLIRQIDTAAQRAVESRRQAETGYQDPIARMKQYGS